MLTIRQDQVDAFRQNALRNFEEKIILELKELFPHFTQKLGESGLRDVVKHGILKARRYGIVRRCDVGRYIAIMLMFGPNFDQKPSSGPLFTTIRDPSFRSAVTRTNALCQAALQALTIRTLRTGIKAKW